MPELAQVGDFCPNKVCADYGKRKVYVGCKPERIQEARRLAASRERWEELDGAARWLRHWTSSRHSDLASLNTLAETWPRVDLGPAGAEISHPESRKKLVPGLGAC